VIPKIDSDIGISIYSTSSDGCGGKIRQNAEDFLVSEILSDKTMSLIKQNDGYVVYKLKKQNIDTNHALKDVFHKTGIRLKSLGLKDASAITEQYVCSMKKSKIIQNFSTKKFSIDKVGFVKKPLTKKDMIGNHFTIKISEPTSDPSKFNDYDKILNFHGYQRFGSSRPMTHLVGKSILQRDFPEAVRLLLSFTSEHDSRNTDLRKRLADESNFKELVSEIPPQMDLEKIVVSEMINHNDHLKAIRALPISIRRFFVQSYQSFIFNRTLCLAFENDEELFTPQEGDVCFDKNGILGKFIPQIVRLSRARTLSLKEENFVVAARGIGAPSWQVIFRHVLPHSLGPIVSYSFGYVSVALVAESALSFLGLGVPPPLPSWGGMIQEGRIFFEVAPWLIIFPGLTLALTAVSFAILGDLLRDIFDPRERTVHIRDSKQ